MPDDLRPLVRRGRDLDLEIKAKTDELKKIKQRLIAAGAGEHEGTDGAKALVIFPSPKIAPAEENLGKVEKLIGPKRFTKLFDQVVSFRPVKAFREVLHALATDTTQEADVLALCESESAAQVRFS